jgi:kanamycin kinase
VRGIGASSIYETSGCSGAATFFVDDPIPSARSFLKIAQVGTLSTSAKMHDFLSSKGLAPRVLQYCSIDRDYLRTAALPGTVGTSWLSTSRRFTIIFGRSLRLLHDPAIDGCSAQHPLSVLIAKAPTASFSQSALNVLAPFIGPADAQTTTDEIRAGADVFRGTAIVHGDYCVPNIVLNDWEFTGFVDLQQSGVGDCHIDLVGGLWSFDLNLKTPDYGGAFLDVYGRDRIDLQRLRVCGLL